MHNHDDDFEESPKKLSKKGSSFLKKSKEKSEGNTKEDKGMKVKGKQNGKIDDTDKTAKKKTDDTNGKTSPSTAKVKETQESKKRKRPASPEISEKSEKQTPPTKKQTKQPSKSPVDKAAKEPKEEQEEEVVTPRRSPRNLLPSKSEGIQHSFFRPNLL